MSAALQQARLFCSGAYAVKLAAAKSYAHALRVGRPYDEIARLRNKLAEADGSLHRRREEVRRLEGRTTEAAE